MTKQDDGRQLLTRHRPAGLATYKEVQEDLEGYEQAALAPNTRRMYTSALRRFKAWCTSQGIEWLPAAPRTVASYLSARAREGRKAGTINMDRQAIRHAHDSRGYPSPTTHPAVQRVVRGLHRTKGTRRDKSAAVRVSELRQALDALPVTDLRAVRNRALLAVGFAGAFRRSELVGIHHEHLAFKHGGCAVFLPSSKTDQERKGSTVSLHRTTDRRYCPVSLLRDWLLQSGIEAGPVFRGVGRYGGLREAALHPDTVNELVKKHLAPFCEDPSSVTAHSLRAGFITEAVAKGVPEHIVQDHSRHKSRAAMHGYIRDAREFRPDTLGRVLDD